MSQAQLEKKVADYLRKSQALEDYWQRPITAEQLQAEMDRMAKHTKQPEVLRELFEALGNDPFVIAECLARPALAERLLTSWYAYDQRIHGELKQRAEADLLAHPAVEEMRQLSGKYSEIELIRGDSRETVGQAHRLPNGQLAGGAPSIQRQDSVGSTKLNSHEWNETAQRLAAMFGRLFCTRTRLAYKKRAGNADQNWDNQSLQEDEERYYAIAVIERPEDRFKLATMSWPKEPLAAWLAKAENNLALTAPIARYELPKSSDGAGCIDDTWTPTGGAPLGRAAHTAVWTGSEMIIWGGSVLNTGGRYDPSTDTWIATTTTNAPDPRSSHTAVWTGSEMIVWGGIGNGFPPPYFNTGGRYNPGTDSWTATSVANAPAGRYLHTAVWTGSEMIVWGGADFFDYFNTGGRYNPNTDSWTATSATNPPDPRASHTAVWTGSEMIVWGGNDSSGVFNTGGQIQSNNEQLDNYQH